MDPIAVLDEPSHERRLIRVAALEVVVRDHKRPPKKG